MTNLQRTIEVMAKQLLLKQAIPVVPELAGMSAIDAACLCSGAVMLYEAAGTPFVLDGIAMATRVGSALESCGVDRDLAVALFKYVPQLEASLAP